jgi:hypothetical protein
MMLYRAPVDLLHDGVAILAELLQPAGFTFALGSVDRGSGGPFAQGSFARAGRALSFSVRQTLGLVHYACAGRLVSHADFMRVVAPVGAAQYSGVSDDPLQAFRDVSTDLRAFGQVFVIGSDADCLSALDAAGQGRPPSGFAALEFRRDRRAL